MRNHDRFKSSFGFIDLLFNLLVGFTFLFLLAFILINPVAKKFDFDPKAEYLVIMTWDDQSASDIDLWVQDNNKHTVSFRSKDEGLMNLDRDDLGLRNDTAMFDESKPTVIEKELNREVVSIRSSGNRTILVTAHWYSAFHAKQLKKDKPTEKVTVEIIRVNPYQVLKVKEVILENEGDEKFIAEMTIKDDQVSFDETDRLIVAKIKSLDGAMFRENEGVP